MEGGCPKGRGLAKVERERSREIFLAHRISQLVSLAVGSILLASRHQTSSVFLSARGDPSAALGMTVRGSSLSVSLGTFDLSASRILIKEVRVCAHHLIEERQYPWSLIPNPCFQISGFGGQRFSRIVISSEVEKSFLHTGYHNWCPWR